jgi:hypothetical protein
MIFLSGEHHSECMTYFEPSSRSSVPLSCYLRSISVTFFLQPPSFTPPQAITNTVPDTPPIEIPNAAAQLPLSST